METAIIGAINVALAPAMQKSFRCNLATVG